MTKQEEYAFAKEDLVHLMAEHPEAQIVTDVGASSISGWGVLVSVTFVPKDKGYDRDSIELVFD